MNNSLSNDQLLKKVSEYNWYHKIHIKDDIWTIPTDALEVNGKFVTHSSQNSHWSQKKVFSVLDKIDFKDKKVLDIGCRDGLFSFYAEKRGASEIVAIDNDLSKGALEFLIPLFNSKVKMYEKNLMDLDEKDYGKFDIIIFVGVLYHLRYPFFALKKIKDMLDKKGKLILETGIYLDENKKAILYCPIENESEFEKTSCTFFNVKGLVDSLKSMGMYVENFSTFEHKIKFRSIKNILRFILRSIFQKKKVFGIKTDHFSKYDQHIGTKIGPITRGIFVSELDEKILDKTATNYWDNIHTFHTRK